MAGRRLTPLHVVELSAALSQLDIIAYGYLDIDQAVVQNIRKVHQTNIQDGNIALINHWKSQHDEPNQLQKLAAILYRASNAGSYVDKGKIREILGVTEEEVQTAASGGASGDASVKKELGDMKIYKLAAKITSRSQLSGLTVALGQPLNDVSLGAINNPGDFTSAALDVIMKWNIDQEDGFVAFDKMRDALKNAGLTSLIQEILMK